jgi:beta-lactamase class A
MSTLTLPEFLHATTKRFSELPAAFAALERANGGRLGIAVRDIATGEGTGYRADERFPMCSTFNSFSRLQSCSASIAIRKP